MSLAKNNAPTRLPLIIAASSAGRTLAVCARRAGFSPHLISPHDDDDVTDPIYVLEPNTCSLDAWHTLQTCPADTPLVYGGGMETRPDLLDATPTLYGNTPETVRKVRDPRHFFTQLQRHKIAYPESQCVPPSGPRTSPNLWLRKTPASSGGQGIHYAHRTTAPHNPRCYYQKHIAQSRALSVTFLANGKQCVPLGFCQQTPDSSESMPMRLGTLQTTIPEHAIRERLAQIAQTLTGLYSLRGINSLDTVRDDDDTLWVLEVNPRPGIALALLDHPPLPPLLACHVRTFVSPDAPLPSMPSPMPSIVRAVRVIYAPKAMTTKPLPEWACDRTPPNTRLPKGAPLCTLYATSDKAEKNRIFLEQAAKKIIACCV